MVDLAVILPEEIWILDFKTDQVEGSDVTERSAEYALQLRLYAKAMQEIFGRKVARLWLHFLKPNRTIEVRQKEALIEIDPNRSARGCPLYSRVRCTNEPAISKRRKANTIPALKSATSGSFAT